VHLSLSHAALLVAIGWAAGDGVRLLDEGRSSWVCVFSLPLRQVPPQLSVCAFTQPIPRRFVSPVVTLWFLSYWKSLWYCTRVGRCCGTHPDGIPGGQQDSPQIVRWPCRHVTACMYSMSVCALHTYIVYIHTEIVLLASWIDKRKGPIIHSIDADKRESGPLACPRC
jgi:hypothetical protein